MPLVNPGTVNCRREPSGWQKTVQSLSVSDRDVPGIGKRAHRQAGGTAGAYEDCKSHKRLAPVVKPPRTRET